MRYVGADVRRPQLVAAARRLMTRSGVSAASMRAVAAEAGVPLGTLQHVFPNKELLLRAVIDDVVAEADATFRTALPAGDGLAASITAGMRTFWTTFVAGQAELNLMQSELLGYQLRASGDEARAAWQYQRYVEAITAWCQSAAARSGETSAIPLDRLARLILAAIDGLTLQYLAEPDEKRARADLDDLIAMIVARAQIAPAPPP